MNKISSKYLFFIVCMILLLFQNPIQTFIPFMQYFDEILSLLAIPVFVINIKNNFNVRKYNAYIVLLFLILIFSGLYSSIVNKYQPYRIIFSDLLLVSKFFLAYSLSEILFNADFFKKHKLRISRITKFIIIIFLGLTILNYIFVIWPQKDFRFGIMSNQLFYAHPTLLAASCIFLATVLLITTNIKNEKKYMVMLVLILMSTLRFKAIGAALVIIILALYISNSNKKLSISKIGIIGIIAAILAWDQISFYYIDLDYSVRNVLNKTSIEIAKDYFPFGTGFASFASYFSALYYSPVYRVYGISRYYELQPGRIAASDVFWPMIIGQFGLIGLVCYLGIIYFIFKKIQSEYNSDDKSIYLAKIICLAYLIISSTSESAFVNPMAIPLALIMGINSIKKEKEVQE